jgi:hypothetical protein
LSETNFDIALVRQQALDNSAPTGRRLAAIDRLASLCNAYNTQAWHQSRYVPTGARPRRWVIYALRRLLKADPTNEKLTALIRDRLIFIRTGQQCGSNFKVLISRDRLWRVEPPSGEPTSIQPQTNEHADEIRRLLEEYEKEANR